MLVVATEQRGGLARWLHPSMAERIARTVAVPTLFVPADGSGCVSLRDGQVTLNRVLIPVDHSPPVGGAVERGLRALAAYGQNEAKLTLLHVGPESGFPSVTIPSGQWLVDRIARQGVPVTVILAAAQESTANLVIMVTKGTDGFLDALRGTTTEQVLRHAPCPVLAVPSDE
jgi:nucleotide-binding universal stress UspA family protein